MHLSLTLEHAKARSDVLRMHHRRRISRPSWRSHRTFVCAVPANQQEGGDLEAGAPTCLDDLQSGLPVRAAELKTIRTVGEGPAAPSQRPTSSHCDGPEAQMPCQRCFVGGCLTVTSSSARVSSPTSAGRGRLLACLLLLFCGERPGTHLVYILFGC